MVVVLTLALGRDVLAQDAGGSRHPQIEAAAQKAVAASKQFLARTTDVYKTGQAPRQTDPSIGPMLGDVFDVGVLKKTNVSAEDGAAVAEWLMASVRVGTVYLGAGTGFTRLPDMLRNLKAREQSDRNVAAYAPEVGRFMDSEIVLETALVSATFAEGPPPDDPMLRKVYEKMRFALEVTISSILKSFAISGLDYEWRLARLAVLDASAPKIARLLDPATCADLHKSVALVSAKLRDSRVTDKLADVDRKLACAKGSSR